MYTFYFEKLEVWQNARKLVKEKKENLTKEIEILNKKIAVNPNSEYLSPISVYVPIHYKLWYTLGGSNPCCRDENPVS